MSQALNDYYQRVFILKTQEASPYQYWASPYPSLKSDSMPTLNILPKKSGKSKPETGRPTAPLNPISAINPIHPGFAGPPEAIPSEYVQQTLFTNLSAAELKKPLDEKSEKH